MANENAYEERTVDVGGVTVEYRIAGPENDRDPIVLVHGSAGNIDRHFGFIFPMMAFRQRVIALNMADPGTETLELEHLVAQVKAVIDDAVPSGPVTLLGNSLGSVVAAKTAAELGSTRVPKLILIAGWVKTDTHQSLRNRLWRKTCDIDPRLTAEFMTLTAFSPYYMSTRTVEEMTAGSARLVMTPFIEKQYELNARIDITDECAQIRSKTLIVAGTDDFMVPRRHQKMLFGAIENSTYTEIPSGHAIVIERPAELFSHIDRFCKRPDLYPAGEIVEAQRP
jgi:pimeloyl-ACP methyl ester carboxylesterase